MKYQMDLMGIMEEIIKKACEELVHFIKFEQF